MNDIHSAYEATSKVLKVYLGKTGNVNSFGLVPGSKKISKARASEIAESNGINLADYITLYKLNQLAGADGKIVVPDQYTAIVTLEEILPEFFIDSQKSDAGDLLIANNSDGDTMTIFDDRLILQTLGVTFEITFDIDEGVYIDELIKVANRFPYAILFPLLLIIL